MKRKKLLVASSETSSESEVRGRAKPTSNTHKAVQGVATGKHNV